MVAVRVADAAFVGGLALVEHRVISVVGATVERRNGGSEAFQFVPPIR